MASHAYPFDLSRLGALQPPGCVEKQRRRHVRNSQPFFELSLIDHNADDRIKAKTQAARNSRNSPLFFDLSSISRDAIDPIEAKAQ